MTAVIAVVNNNFLIEHKYIYFSCVDLMT